jgi:NADH-quinone oxidoreductase subunit N
MIALWLPIAVAAAAVLVLLVDLALPAPRPRLVGGVAAALLGAVLVAAFAVDVGGAAAGGAFVHDGWTDYFGKLFLAAGVIACLGSIDHVAQATARRAGEYYLLLMLSIAGMTLVPGARDLLLLIVAFELAGMPLYVLAAHAKTDAAGIAGKGRSPAAEAAMKLYLVGAASTAITLFGLSLVVGMAGTTRLGELAAAPLGAIGTAGVLLVVAGLSFKLGVVPFHVWVPDTYQGAPTPFVAFLSVAPKAVGVAALITVAGLAPVGTVLAIVAAASMLAGNLLALPQNDTRRLLGYSGIAQMGVVLVALAAGGPAALGTAAFFLGGYLFTNLGAFLVVHAVAEDGGGHDVGSLAGLARRSPWLGAALLLFLLSLAGIPFVIGFWTKLYVFLAAYRAGLGWLVALGVALAVVALFYYLRVARAAYMSEPVEPRAPRLGAPLGAAIFVCLVAIVGLGLWPRPLHDAASRAGVEQGERR